MIFFIVALVLAGPVEGASGWINNWTTSKPIDCPDGYEVLFKLNADNTVTAVCAKEAPKQ